jgi:hypothetical protein
VTALIAVWPAVIAPKPPKDFELENLAQLGWKL